MAGRSVINVLVNADTRDFVGGMDKASRRVGGFVTGGIKNLAKLGAAFGAVGAVAAGAFAKSAISAAEEMTTANDRIKQINESMGLFGLETNHVSARLIRLANDMAFLTGVSQNEIKESQALLLTFGEIAKSADEVGGAFDRATKLTVDMAAAGFGSATDNAKQLGKALNDPITGISALARSGVTFNEQEKELIKTLVESGKQLEAQDMILSAIEKQVGGTAEATANASDKIRVGFSQVMERAGMALLPLFEKLTGFLLDKVFPVLERLGSAFAEDGLGGAFRTLGETLKSVINSVLPILQDWLVRLGGWFISDGLPFIAGKLAELGQALVDWIKPRIKPALEALGDLLGRLGRWLLDTGLPTLGRKLQELGKALIDWIQPQIKPALNKLGEFIASAAQWFVDDGLPMLVDKLILLGNALVDWIKPRIVPMLEALGELLVAILDWIVTEGVPKLVVQAAKLAGALIDWVFELAPEILKGLGKMLVRIVDWIVSDGIPTLLGAGADLGGALLDGVVDGLQKLVSSAGDVAGDIASAIVSSLKWSVNNLLITPLNNAIQTAVDVLDVTLGPFINFDDNKYRSTIPHLAEGGIVTKPTLAMIGEAGAEAVVPLTGRNAGGFGGATNITINMPVGSNGDDVVRALKSYTQARGGLPMQTLSKVR
jgi:hypothetical protein